MSKTLADVGLNLHSGTGFVVLRGLNPTKYSPLDNVLLYLGVTSHIAEIRGCQDYDGRMIGKSINQRNQGLYVTALLTQTQFTFKTWKGTCRKRPDARHRIRVGLRSDRTPVIDSELLKPV
jgi:hypothetical protein